MTKSTNPHRTNNVLLDPILDAEPELANFQSDSDIFAPKQWIVSSFPAEENKNAVNSLEVLPTKKYLETNFDRGCACPKILIVDDLAFNLLALEWMIKNKFSLIPEKAFSGQGAIEKVEQRLLAKCCKAFPLILMDYYMPPGMNGSEASLKIKKILKSHNLNSYIACLTSQREGDFAFTKSLKNFDNFYSKPLSVEDMKDILVLDFT